MTTETTKSAGCGTMLLAIVVGMPYGMAFLAAAVRIEWGWFAIPLGAPSIGFCHAYGVTLLARTVRGWSGLSSSPKRSDAEVLTDSFVLPPIAAGLLVGIGYLVHLGMMQP